MNETDPHPPPATITVRRAREDDRARWDEFCAANRASYASFSHWQGILEKLGQEPLFLLAETPEGVPCGCLPLAISRGLVARRAVSAWGDGQTYGGPLVTAPDAIAPLMQAAERLLSQAGVAWLGLMPDPCQPLFGQVCARLEEGGYRCVGAGASGGFTSLNDESCCHIFRVPLDGWDKVFARFHRNVRKRARGAERRGLSVDQVSTEEFCLPFHRLQVEVWRRLGNTCPSLERLRQVLGSLGDGVRMYLARIDGEVVGGLYVFYAGRVCFVKGAASDDRYANFGVNSVMDSRAIEDAARAGYEIADLGWTPPPRTSGHHVYKNAFGGIAYPILTYKRVLNPMTHFLDRGFSRLTDRLARRISYEPAWVRALGPVGRVLVRWTRR